MLVALPPLLREGIKELRVVLVDQSGRLTCLRLVLLQIEFDEFALAFCAVGWDWMPINQVRENIYYRNFQY